MPANLYTRFALLGLLIISSPLSAKNILYVSDELTIPMRSGPTTSHKILKFLTSGTAVNIIETSEDQEHSLVSLVEDDSKSGWVVTALLMPQTSARVQLITANKTIQTLKDKHSELKDELSRSQKNNTEMQAIQKQLDNKIQELLTTLTNLKASAAEPIRVAEENEQLKQRLQQEKLRNADLEQKNAFLSDQNIKQWFLIGGGVSIGSLILGLLITRIRWKKQDSWAGSF